MIRRDDPASGHEQGAAPGDPPRDPVLRALLTQDDHDDPDADADFVARIRPELATALRARRPSVIPISSRRPSRVAVPLGIAASLAATVFALTRPIVNPSGADEVLLSAAVGAVTPQSTTLWFSLHPFGLGRLASGSLRTP